MQLSVILSSILFRSSQVMKESSVFEHVVFKTKLRTKGISCRLRRPERNANGVPAVVGSIKDFKQNFDLFSESALVDMDWSNVVAAGSSVVTALLPVPEPYSGSKRALREYDHERLAPASDVDRFIYGPNEDEAIQKIKHIETKIKDSILQETTVSRFYTHSNLKPSLPSRLCKEDNLTYLCASSRWGCH